MEIENFIESNELNLILFSGQNLQVHIIIVMTKNAKNSFVSKNDLICHQVFVWYIQLFLQKLLSF